MSNSLFDDLANLGADRDARRPAVGWITPWAPGDEPHSENLDLDEFPVEVLRLKQCRSFRADLRHKLTIIIRAYGGYGRQGMRRAAETLGVGTDTLAEWLKWERTPRARHNWERIDNLYVDSLEQLVADKLRKKSNAVPGRYRPPPRR